MLPALPEGGGAEAGRGRSPSVERLTAVTDRSATGISEDCPRASPHYSRGRGHSPPRSARGPCFPGPESNAVKPAAAESSQVESSQSGRRPGEATLPQRCNAGNPRLPEGSSRLVINYASVLPHTVCRASLARPRHARSRVRPNQVKSSQVQVTSGVPPVCHARAAMGRAWPMPRAHAPPRHAPRPP